MSLAQRIAWFGARKLYRKPCALCQNRSFALLKDAEEKPSEKQTHFGFETVSETEKTKRVLETQTWEALLQSNDMSFHPIRPNSTLFWMRLSPCFLVFHRVADTYDLMNDVMSAGVHRIWKDMFIERLSPPSGTKLLDVAGGTGDIAFRFVNHVKNAGHTGTVTVCDINPDMLRVGQDRARQKNYVDIDWVEGNAEELPFPDNTFTAYTIAFGIRNVTRIDLALKEAWRVLKPGGRFMCLEFSHVENEQLRWLYDKYSFQMIPAMGQVVAGDWKSYQYLVESIRKFPDQETFAGMIENAGFWAVSYENLTFGVVAIHSAFKL